MQCSSGYQGSDKLGVKAEFWGCLWTFLWKADDERLWDAKRQSCARNLGTQGILGMLFDVDRNGENGGMVNSIGIS